MPNTLAHVGAQSLLTRLVFRDADPKWIYVGCVIPDVPWIVQRAALGMLPGLDPYPLRFYVDGQASLLGCLLLCAAIASLSGRFWTLFGILGGNAVLHLLLDACQTKWANGVHFGAPFSWALTNWGLFWPESLLTYVLTGGGLAYILWQGRRSVRHKPDVGRPRTRQWIGFIALMTAYILGPLLFVHGPEEADNHYLKTLRTPEERLGRYVEFDRARVVGTPEGVFVQCCNAEEIRVEGLDAHGSTQVSLRGIFITPYTLRVLESHVHLPWFRKNASYLGLALIVLVWMLSWATNTPSRPTEEKD